MSTFKPYPELVIEVDGRIYTTAGDDFMVNIVQIDKQDVQRLVDCWNACRKIHSPAAHIAATDEYVERIEKLRKDACARIVELEAELRTKETSGEDAVSMSTEWNFDLNSIPRGTMETRTRTIKGKSGDPDKTADYDVFTADRLWVATARGEVVISEFVPPTTHTPNGRWLNMASGSAPIAWMPFERPVHPHATHPQAPAESAA